MNEFQGFSIIFGTIGIVVILSAVVFFWKLKDAVKAWKESMGYIAVGVEAAKQAQSEGKDVHRAVEKAQLEAIRQRYGGKLPRGPRADGFNTVIGAAMMGIMAYLFSTYLVFRLFTDLSPALKIAWQILLFGLPAVTAAFALSRMIVRPFAKSGFLAIYADRDSPWTRLEGLLLNLSFFTLFASVFGSIMFVVIAYGN